MTPRSRFEILHRDEFTCRYCGSRPGQGGLEVDHLVPRSFGGSDHASNLIAACFACNRGKSSGTYAPAQMVVSGPHKLGAMTVRQWGGWSLRVIQMREPVPEAWTLAHEESRTWISLQFVHDDVWNGSAARSGMSEPDAFVEARDYCRTLVRRPAQRWAA